MKFYWKLAAYLDTSNQNKNERMVSTKQQKHLSITV